MKKRKPNKTVVLVTGTSSGIGLRLARHYAGAGHEVVGCSRRPSGLKTGNYRHFRLDVRDEAKVRSMFAAIAADYGRLDVLINNAGVYSANHVLLTPLQDVRDVFDVNVFGAFLFCREAAKLMKKNGHGRIVNISSAAVPLARAGTAAYGASKSALEQFSRVFAEEVAAYGITVNTLGLSIVDLPGMRDQISERAVTGVLERTAFGSKLEFREIAGVVDFLISKAGAKMTRQTLYLGGV